MKRYAVKYKVLELKPPQRFSRISALDSIPECETFIKKYDKGPAGALFSDADLVRKPREYQIFKLDSNGNYSIKVGDPYYFDLKKGGKNKP